jgi:hypothetical protein
MPDPRRWISTLALMCLAACGAHKAPATMAYEEAYVPVGVDFEDDYLQAPAAEMAAPPPQRKRAGRPASPPPPPPPPAAVPGNGYGGGVTMAEPEAEPDEVAGPDRMIHYDGFAQIRTPRAEELVEKVIALAEEAGGSVENRTLSRVTVRVPVADFDATWTAILDLGPVVQRSLGAEDVTDAFTDLDLRLRSMEATLERLNQLLAKEAELPERLRLLGEIHRLSGEIRLMEARLQVLADLAAMSRITVVAVAPDLHANATRALPYGMTWIDLLSAFNHEMVWANKKVSLSVPEGFVALDPPRFHAQAADGATAWAFALKNDPQGTAGFWRDAVVDRIGDQLEDGTTSEHGGWSLVRFVEPGAKEPYVWHLGFRVEGQKLQVFQVTYPTTEQEERYHDAVLSGLKEGQA